VTLRGQLQRAAHRRPRPHDRKFLGQLKDPDGEPIHIDHLWALKVGNGGNGGRTDTVYFTAGIDNEQHGLFGSLTPVAAGTPEGPAEAQAVAAAVDVVQLDLAKLTSDISSGAPQSTIVQDRQTLQMDFAALVRAEQQFAQDSSDDQSANEQGRLPARRRAPGTRSSPISAASTRPAAVTTSGRRPPSAARPPCCGHAGHRPACSPQAGLRHVTSVGGRGGQCRTSARHSCYDRRAME